MTALIRTTSFIGFRELVTELGGDPIRLLERFRVPINLLDEEDASVQLRTLIELLECAAEELDCPDFGLRMAEYQDIHILGPVAIIARSSATAGQALAELVRFIGYHSPGIELDLDLTVADAPRMAVDIRLPGVHMQRQMVELSMGVAHNIMRLLFGPSFAAQTVLLSGISPLPQARYRRYFKTSVYDAQPVNAFVLTAAQLHHRIEQQDPSLHRAMVQYLSHIGAQKSTSLLEQVNRLIFRLLPTNRCRLVIIAAQLGLHPRLLQRRLAEEGCRFDELVEQVRRNRAEHYLSERHMPMSQVAGLLGYSEQSVFNRSCKRWFGVTPGEYRRQLLAR
ncbi:AraC family transcriptional regulator [Pseudomonas sp. M30-35]|uniref:AraC family transcriptional regulator n=1 Tax=Pseudomonas sp. M30-35 TaxID=1981174 RepID=UPI000B3BEF1E|nr:AraC family transcriptional regulator [Pseudomonas sp. M30-35]ARU89019.1 AraC family transcriptional regulator [Pseudomonas sp. M30-35]